jgi:glyoxylase-like metal-dependent hydrolase (beta-lactamase superfamily II)
VHHVGGHTPGSQLVSVAADARRVVLTADAAHLYANLAEGVPFPVLHDVPSSCVAFEVITGMDDDATDVIPGHDGEVRRRFPTVGGLPEGSVVQLL